MKRFSALVFFILIAAVSRAQNNGAYLIPRLVYVGDHATLILPLPEADQNADIVLTPQSFFPLENDFPFDPDIDFHRIVLERRVSGSRLLIEFTAFIPGLLELPVIEIGGERFGGLSVKINSVIDTKVPTLELSGPASSLAMPGTALMLYGTMTGFVLLIILIIWFVLKGRRYLQRWIIKWKRWKSFVSIKNTEKRLHKILLRGGNKRIILDRLSGEFRNFLSFITGNNCRAMTAREFEILSDAEFDGCFLGKFFRQCDELRFSGTDVNSQEIFRLLADLRIFVGKIEKPKTEKQTPKEEMAA